MDHRPRTTARRLAKSAALAVLALAVWQLALPPGLGGRTTVVVAQGSSMRPDITKGDLIFVRAKPDARIGKGDVVLYQSKSLGRYVLHRVKRVERSGKLVMKGDANDFIDPEKPRPDEVVGHYWFRIPGAGDIPGVGSPMFTAVAIGLAVMLMGLGGMLFRWRPGGRPEPDGRDAGGHPPITGGGPSESASSPGPRAAAPASSPQDSASAAPATAHWQLWGLGACLIVAALGLWFAFGRGEAKVGAPSKAAHASTAGASLEHRGELSYTAKVGSDALEPSGQAATGDAVFTQRSGPVQLRFNYRLSGDKNLEDAPATGRLLMEVNDQNGWRMESTLADKEIEAGDGELAATLDLKQLRKRLGQFERASNTTPLQYRIFIRAEVDIATDAPKSVAGEHFEAEVPFVLDDHRFRPEVITGGDAVAQFTPVKAIGDPDDVTAPGGAQQAAGNGRRNIMTVLAAVMGLGSIAYILVTGKQPESVPEVKDARPTQSDPEDWRDRTVRINSVENLASEQPAVPPEPRVHVDPEPVRQRVPADPSRRRAQAGRRQATPRAPETVTSALALMQRSGVELVNTQGYEVEVGRLRVVGNAALLAELARLTSEPVYFQPDTRRPRLLVRDLEGGCYCLELAPDAGRSSGWRGRRAA